MAGIGRTRAGRRSRFAYAWRGSTNSLRAIRHDAGARSPSSAEPGLLPGSAPALRAARQTRLRHKMSALARWRYSSQRMERTGRIRKSARFGDLFDRRAARDIPDSTKNSTLHGVVFQKNEPPPVRGEVARRASFRRSGWIHRGEVTAAGMWADCIYAHAESSKDGGSLSERVMSIGPRLWSEAPALHDLISKPGGK
jgi:hypothetical protein